LKKAISPFVQRVIIYLFSVRGEVMADDCASRSAETAQSKPVLVFVACRVRL